MRSISKISVFLENVNSILQTYFMPAIHALKSKETITTTKARWPRYSIIYINSNSGFEFDNSLNVDAELHNISNRRARKPPIKRN